MASVVEARRDVGDAGAAADGGGSGSSAECPALVAVW